MLLARRLLPGLPRVSTNHMRRPARQYMDNHFKRRFIGGLYPALRLNQPGFTAAGSRSVPQTVDGNRALSLFLAFSK